MTYNYLAFRYFNTYGESGPWWINPSEGIDASDTRCVGYPMATTAWWVRFS